MELYLQYVVDVTFESVVAVLMTIQLEVNKHAFRRVLLLSLFIIILSFETETI